MYENITPEYNAALDVIIRARRSVRAFSPIPPERKAIEAIIRAGLFAPFPALAVAAQSLSFCLQNMWLKATSLGIGFQLVSAAMQMDSDPDFCKLLSIPCGEYALDGCALGYPADTCQPPSVEYPTADKSVSWL
ncbi:MAG: nitroreductase family protein [Candidatus Aminicenantes bacterium]|nr:nitroreductase family protein [Candidatus Aminicenantes bacterium]